MQAEDAGRRSPRTLVYPRLGRLRIRTNLGRLLRSEILYPLYACLWLENASLEHHVRDARVLELSFLVVYHYLLILDRVDHRPQRHPRQRTTMAVVAMFFAVQSRLQYFQNTSLHKKETRRPAEVLRCFKARNSESAGIQGCKLIQALIGVLLIQISTQCNDDG